MTGNASGDFDLVVKRLSLKSEVSGLYLGGSRAKGYHDERSDYDLWVIVDDKSIISSLSEEIKQLNLHPDVGVVFKTISDLKEYIKWGRHDAWVRYSFTDTKPLLDKKGQLQKLIDKIGTYPRKYQAGLVNGALGAYQNSLYRSIKAHYREKKFAALTEAGRSLEHLIAALFVLHLRFKPYNDYLEKEINKLELIGDLRNDLMERFLEIITTANPKEQWKLKLDVEKIFRNNGFSEAFDEWTKTFEGFSRKYPIF